ncbi:hypothetical protein LCGC14_3029540 [marine sediment metagenome]|uniref:Uncharacterized protein n=1 Tax=marine sediment metagenome TaxID=412755 RepID=A0A0F8XG35_9ZZZZ
MMVWCPWCQKMVTPRTYNFPSRGFKGIYSEWACPFCDNTLETSLPNPIAKRGSDETLKEVTNDHP